ncbi:MAG: tandem-95 repeat protein [Chryseolinea sp.]
MRFLGQILLSFFLFLCWSSYAQPILLPPLITGQKTPNPIVINEDDLGTPIEVTNLTIFDLDSNYPDDFTITVNGGANYTVIDNVVTPDPDYNGSMSVTVTVNDGTANSLPFDVQIQVNAVNDEPSFVKGVDQSVLEDGAPQNVAGWATSISKGPANESGQTLTFSVSNDNTALFSVQPSINSGTGNLSYTPAINANGVANVSVILTDNGGTANAGDDTFTTQTFTITVTSINNEPSFVKGPNQSILEDGGAQSVTNWATAISAGPADESGQVLTFTLSNDNTTLFSVQPSINSTTGTLTYTPATNANGIANVSVILTDNGGTANGGDDTFATQTFTITVTSVNDEPSFVKGIDQSVNEGAAAQTVAGWATSLGTGPANESAQLLMFNLTNTNNALFSVQPAISAAGTLTYTPSASISGSATVTVVLSDNGGTSNGGDDTFASQTFTITITTINDEPSFVKGANQTILEDGGAQSITNWATSISAGSADESGQVLTFSLSNDNTTLFAVQPSINSTTGTLTYTPAVNANGAATVSVILTDNGGTANGGDDTFATQTFTIMVTSVNDEPSFVKGPDQSVGEGAPTQNVSNWATAMSPGPANESSQTLTFAVTNNNNGLFSQQPSINASNGNLSYKPATGISGVATVTVILSDNGGTTNGGDDTFTTQMFTITVSSTNDEPSFVKGANQTILEDAGAQTVINWATSISAGPPDESSQTLTFTLSNDNTSLFSVQPSINAATGTLTYTPAANANGIANVSVVLADNGGTANGGDNTFATQTFTITVNAVNDEPSFVKGSDQNVNEGATAQTVTNWATSISAGPSNESGQALSFNVTNNNNGLFSVQPSISPTGTLTYTLAGNGSGIATVTVVLSDNGGTTNGGDDTFASQTFSITVVSINDEPSFVKGANQTILEDAGAQTVTNWATSISAGPPDESSQVLTFTVSNNNAGLFLAQPSINSTTGTLNYTPAANANGLATVSVILTDNGGTVNGGDDTFATQTFTITVTSVNDEPSFVKGSDQSVLEDATAQTVTNWATSISKGPSDESSQILTLNVTNNNNGLFSVQPAINVTTGTLTYTPLANASGIATVTVVLSDNGGTANGGDDTFTTQTFTITINPVNDLPTITGQSPNPIIATEDTQFTPSVSNLTISDTDNTTFTLTVLPGTNYGFIGNQVTPALNYNGPLTVNVKVNDGTSDSPSFGMAFQVNAVNDAPVITGQVALSTGDGQPLTLKFSDLTVFDPDNTYPTGFDLFILNGANYSVSGFQITPVVGFSGNLVVKVFVNDGALNSVNFNLTIQVNYTNKPPTITGQNPNPVAATEDTQFTPLVSNLTISDPDNTTFALTVLPGTNYAFSGNVVTPALNYNGPLTVNVKVNDGAVDSPSFGMVFQVAPVNDGPTIASQTPNPISATEDTQFTPSLSNLVITDPDNTTFTLTVLSGTNYTFSGNVVTPALNYNGPLTVNVKVRDGALDSPSFGMVFQVGAVNDAPSITGQNPNPINAVQNTMFSITLSNLIVFDPDNTVLTATVLPGTNYTFSGNNVTPALNFNGTLTVNVKVNDGTTDSPSFGVAVLVSAVNVAPIISGQTPNPISATEDTQFTIQLSNLIITDPDDATFALTVLAGTNYIFSGNNITPALNYSGPLTVNVRVNDGIANSPNFGVAVQVAAVNDIPLITGQSTLTINEDQQLTILPSHLMVTDPDDTYPSGFTLTVQSGTNYTFSGNIITPASNFFGNLNVNVIVNDGAANSAVFPLLVKVNSVNDAPTKLGFAALNLVEGNLVEQTVNLLTNFNDVEDAPAQLTYQISANDNPTFFQAIAIDQALGQLHFTLNPNAFGTAKVTIRASDTGGQSVTDILTINIGPINDAPSFDPIADQQVVENSPQQTINIVNISKGPFEGAQELTFFVSSSNASIIPNPTITYDGVSTTAQLKYTIAPSTSGTVEITVNVVDNGSNVLPNKNTFTEKFNIEVSEINDPPTLNAIVFGPIQEDAVLQNVPLAGITAGPGETQTLTVTVSTNKPELFEILDVTYQSPQTTGTLRIKPKANANGTAQISVRVQDSGPNIPPVSINFLVRTFSLTIQSVNDLPVFVSSPVLTANIAEQYTYNIKVKDVEGETLTLTAPIKPAWASLLPVAVADTAACHCNFKLTGIPPAGSDGSTSIKLQVKDSGGVLVDQVFTLVVNARPTLASIDITTNEDVSVNIASSKFATAFLDADPLAEIKIVTLPKHGTIKSNNTTLAAGDKVSATSLANGLVYTPFVDYFGRDTIKWNGSDGVSYAISASNINIIVNAVNDAPVISALEEDTDLLRYKSGSGPVQLTKLFEVQDVDDDSLERAEIRFGSENFHAPDDILIFTNTQNLTGNFNAQTGVLLITGKAPLSEYDSAIRHIQYHHLNAIDPVVGKKTISITLDDGSNLSISRNRFISLYFENVALDIPNGFTPADDASPNNTWNILFEGDNPHKNPELKDAILKIYNSRGLMVFETVGFEKEWDGRMNGQTSGDFVPADTYFYTIDLKSSNKKTFKGTVTVLR